MTNGCLLSRFQKALQRAWGAPMAIGRNPAGTPAVGRVCCGSGGLRRFVQVVLRCCRGSAEKGVAANPWRFAVAAEIVAVKFL